MKIDITARNITISEELRNFIHEKLQKVIKYDKNILSVKIILLKESRAEKVDLLVESKDNRYFCKCYSSVFEKTILMAINNIINQISRTRKKK